MFDLLVSIIKYS